VYDGAVRQASMWPEWRRSRVPPVGDPRTLGDQSDG